MEIQDSGRGLICGHAIHLDNFLARVVDEIGRAMFGDEWTGKQATTARGRSWQGLHRHALMTMIAYAFLQHATARWEKKNQRAAASANFARRTPRHPRTLRSITAAAVPALSKMDLQRAAA